MNNIVLVLNAGSSSIKFSFFHFETLKLISYGEIDDIFGSATFLCFDKKHKLILKRKLKSNGYAFGLKFFFNWFENSPEKSILKAVGHRIVHGGSDFFEPIQINNHIIQKLTKLIPLAPLHQPHNIEAIKIISKIYPDIIQVGCFDTAFHQTQNRLATLFAIPGKLTKNGMIRYGFHGLSYEYVTSILPDKINVTRNKKIIVAHLGNGASVCALFNLKSMATSMGFTALDGLMMGTRCGAIDPGLILYLFQEKKLTIKQITHLLYQESGLLGVSGVSSDIRELLASKKEEAKEAVDLFCYRTAREISALLPILKGCDAIVFTAGIGENSSIIRKKICGWLDWMGIKLNDTLNNKNDAIISESRSKIVVAVVATDEDYMIAKHTLSLIQSICSGGHKNEKRRKKTSAFKKI